MDKRYALPLTAALGGAAACVLRLLQNHTGYEADTGLPIPGNFAALALAVLLAGLPIAAVVCREVSRQSFAGEIVPYQFPVLEMGLFFLALFGSELLLSAWTVRRQKRQSLIEQMRATE